MDAATRQIIGYARFNLPDTPDVDSQWIDAQMAAPDEETVDHAEQTFKQATTFQHDASLDAVDVPYTEMERRVLGDRKVISA